MKEQVPWAERGSRFTVAFEQEVTWLVQRGDLSAVAEYFRITWRSVRRIIRRVVEQKWNDRERLDGLYSYKREGCAKKFLEGWARQDMWSKLEPINCVARMIRAHFDGVVSWVTWGISNGRLEGTSSGSALTGGGLRLARCSLLW